MLDVERLRALQDEIPRTRIALVRLIWSEVKPALDRGHSLKAVHQRLTDAGLDITYRRLSQCVNRLRREEKRFGLPPKAAGNTCMSPDVSSASTKVGDDGNAGLHDKVDRHYKRLFGSAALSSLFSAAFDVSQRQNQSVLNYPSPTQTAEASVSRNMSETGSAITRRNLNVQPTIKVPAGYRFTVRVDRDILFDAPYEPIQADPQAIPKGMQWQQRSRLLSR